MNNGNTKKSPEPKSDGNGKCTENNEKKTRSRRNEQTSQDVVLYPMLNTIPELQLINVGHVGSSFGGYVTTTECKTIIAQIDGIISNVSPVFTRRKSSSGLLTVIPDDNSFRFCTRLDEELQKLSLPNTIERPASILDNFMEGVRVSFDPYTRKGCLVDGQPRMKTALVHGQKCTMNFRIYRLHNSDKNPTPKFSLYMVSIDVYTSQRKRGLDDEQIQN